MHTVILYKFKDPTYIEIYVPSLSSFSEYFTLSSGRAREVGGDLFLVNIETEKRQYNNYRVIPCSCTTSAVVGNTTRYNAHMYLCSVHSPDDGPGTVGDSISETDSSEGCDLSFSDNNTDTNTSTLH